jgi:hypothetical protein
MEVVIAKNKQELERLEGIIQKNIGSFYEVGRSLAEIRDQELYSKVRGIANFETYCKERWDFTRMYAHYLIESSKVIENVNHGLQNTPTPANERQARPLAKLEPAQQIVAWQKAIDITPEGKPVTAAIVAKVVKGLTKTKLTKAERRKKEKRKISTSEVDPNLKAALEQVLNAIKLLTLTKWKTMKRKEAIKQLQILIDIIENQKMEDCEYV